MSKRLLDRSTREELKALTCGRIAFDKPLAPLTTFKTGGSAEAFYEAEDIKELSSVVAFASSHEIPYLVMGKGSNILVLDGGLPGLVIRLAGGLASIMRECGEGCRVLCGGGASISDLLQYCRREGLSGLEFMAGIPGTVGGAAAMNAGAFGREISGNLLSLRILDHKGILKEKPAGELSFSYRRLSLEKGAVITHCALALSEGSADEISERISVFLKKRREKQPLDLPSAGSVFRNPPGDFAGRLIEAAGLKGISRGGAAISPLHANWIVNTGGAKSADILGLIELAASRVKEMTGIELELEINIVGEGV
jgi:UDP-N-acetylmuramate dehydrogenase